MTKFSTLARTINGKGDETEVSSPSHLCDGQTRRRCSDGNPGKVARPCSSDSCVAELAENRRFEEEDILVGISLLQEVADVLVDFLATALACDGDKDCSAFTCDYDLEVLDHPLDSSSNFFVSDGFGVQATSPYAAGWSTAFLSLWTCCQSSSSRDYRDSCPLTLSSPPLRLPNILATARIDDWLIILANKQNINEFLIIWI